MSSLLIPVLTLLLLISPSSSSRHVSDGPTPVARVRIACTATRFPDECVSSLSRSGLISSNPKPFQIVRSAVTVSYKTLKTARSMVKSILDSSAGNKNLTDAANTCQEMLSYSDHRTKSTDVALTRNEIRNARAWMSATLSYQYDCWSGLKYFNLTKEVNETASLLHSLISYSSNALSMMMSYDNFGNDVALWTPPLTERNGFWDGTGSGAGNNRNRKLTFGFPSGLTANVTVCKDGASGCYKTVQDGVNAAPNNGEHRFVIRIKEGVYKETVRVPFEKQNVVFVGDGRGKTVITGSLNVGQPGMTTYASATVGVLGDGFMARDLTIQNTAGSGENAHQAVAFRSDSDLSLLENCEFLGNQDTLYAHSLRQLYKSCRIQGNVDFIFGNAAAVFQDCEIMIAPRPPGKGETNVVTAQARTDPSQTTGFVFVGCLINGTQDYMKLYRANPAAHRNYLGRPWKEYSRTVFVGNKMEELISPEGWMPWIGDFAFKTLFYGELKNTGPGARTSGRVPWSSLIPDDHMKLYSAESFIQADEWATTSS